MSAALANTAEESDESSPRLRHEAGSSAPLGRPGNRKPFRSGGQSEAATLGRTERLTPKHIFLPFKKRLYKEGDSVVLT